MPKRIKLDWTVEEIRKILNHSEGNATLQEGRNFIIRTTLESGEEFVIKSFKKPNFINKIAYRYFRKSKAKRSFEYAQRLRNIDIGTPEPLAYLEQFDKVGLTESYYISRYQTYDLTFRELVEVPNYPDWENILRQFTRFTFGLHEKGVLFKDHSPGNTLIQKGENDEYHFYLVDLNRMEFRPSLSFEERMHNMRRLTPKKEMVEIMSDEYSKLYPKSFDVVFQKMWTETQNFQKKFHRKQALKKKWKA